MHPAIANPAPGLVLRAAPLFAVADGMWNHGEGFAPNDQLDEDFAGWFNNDDGTGLTILDVHVDPNTNPPWQSFQWSSPIFNGGASVNMRRLEGWLRPQGRALRTEHPRYGPLGQGYVDQGAFELFIPATIGPSPNQKIVICVMTRETVGFPVNALGQGLQWRQIYMGYFSPDGLERREHAQGFLQNTDDGTFDDTNTDGVVRPKALQVLAGWISNPSSSYWPILAYPTLSVMHRQTTLNEQRYMQLVQAVKLLLQEASPRNPIHPLTALTSTQVEQRCVVCFAGGSNGGMSSQMATLRYPRFVHGCFAEVINPAYQRLYSELDMSLAISWLSATATIGGLSADDFLHWDQYAWSQALEMHDLSYLRHFVAGRTYRPAAFAVGDEDITSTGTDWVRVLSNGAWTDSGVTPLQSGPTSAPHRVGWMVAENGCHEVPVPVTDPYASPPSPGSYNGIEHARYVIEDACTQRDYELANPTLPPPPEVAFVHETRTPAQQLRGLDDPSEWFVGRLGESLPSTVGAPLERDDGFFTTVQPGACGTMPGTRESMMVRGGLVYVGSADGFVSSFEVDTGNAKQPLRLVARSARLGHAALALAALEGSGSWELLVGTRRHLHRLDPVTLAGPSVQLPWEVAQPHHLKVADVLPGHPGAEVVFASVHGGLVFYDTTLNPVHEWPEPGILDFAVLGSTVTILSTRGMLANVTFSSTNVPTLVAASKPVPIQLVQYVSDPANHDAACQGVPGDMELMQLDWSSGGGGTPVAVMSTWSGDTDSVGVGQFGVAIRAHGHTTLARVPLPFTNPTSAWVDLATCSQSSSYGAPDIGDHLLALAGDGTLALIDQLGTMIGKKNLTTTAQGYWPFGAGAQTMAVGDLVANSGPYEQEIVVATKTGLMWLHVNDLLGVANTQLPAAGTPQGAYVSGYYLETVRNYTGTPPLTTSHVQARTNQCLSATWSIARRPDPSSPTGFDAKLHVLDQRGNYWRVAHGGQVELWEREEKAAGSRGWGYVGPVAGLAQPFTIPALDYLFVTQTVTGTSIAATPWVSRRGEVAIFQFAPIPWQVPDGWGRAPIPRPVFDGFLVFDWCGSAVSTSSGARQAWMWSASPLVAWSKLVEGYSIDSSDVVSGTWSSVAEPVSVSPTTGLGTGCNHLQLRSYFGIIPVMSQQAVHAAYLPASSQTALVLGCAGGRVRTKLISPGDLRTGNSTPQQIGSLAASSTDLGYGGGALAVRQESGGNLLRIWFGTVAHPSVRPQNYGQIGGALQDHEVVSGAVHMMTWAPGAGMSSVLQTIPYHPVNNSRGAYGVVGLKHGDLLPNPGDELVVATLSGDLIVYNIDPGTHLLSEIWRTYVTGGIGFYNSIAIEDLDNDGKKELYVAGSLGLWRFKQPGE